MTENPIDKSLGLAPYEVFDHETGEITEVAPTQLQEEQYEDPHVKQATEDAAMVRLNLLDLMEEGMEMMRDAALVAKTNQDADSYGAAARWYAEVVKANKELMNVHKDVIGIKPPAPIEVAPIATQQNVFIATTSEELMQMLKDKGIGKLPSRKSD